MDWKAPAQGTLLLLVVTAVTTMLVTRYGGQLLTQIGRPFIWLKENIYKWIAPRNPLSISIHSYKKHLKRSNLSKIENPVGPALDISLDQAFAPLKLLSSSSQEGVELFSYTASHKRFIVLGGPGTGKTTLMKSLVMGIAEGRLVEELNDLIPVFVVLRKMAGNQLTVEQAIVSAFADYHFPKASKFVESALGQGKMLIILDGLDEVGANREYIANEIIQFCELDNQRTHTNRLIVTCREHSYRMEDLRSVVPEIVRVEPFSNFHMRAFLQGWPIYKQRSALKLYGLIQKDAQIRDACRNPLLLTILTGLYLDTDNFEFPKSRERFYNSTIDELLINRPGRRSVKQSFDPDEKRKILERLSLERLETLRLHEDSEEFERELIKQQAASLLSANFDFPGLLKELVEVNGIIKPSGDSTYTFSHRTIQEYLAAREASRTRRTDEVIKYFGNRTDLIQVLYFYCAILTNIPQIESVLVKLINQEKWLEAGQCMLYLKEVPNAELITTVSVRLFEKIRADVDKQALEILSSLSQRSGQEFESSKDYFSRTVEFLTNSSESKNASALSSILSTSPEMSMQLIPGLLAHPSARWRSVGIELLKGIGTDEALDMLIQLLVSEDKELRLEAAKTLESMIKSRFAGIVRRASLLPARQDETIWPLGKLFPSNIAIYIAEPLSETSATITNSAIRYAVAVIKAQSRLTSDGPKDFLRKWIKLPRDYKLDYRKRRLAGLLKSGFTLISILVLMVMFFLLSSAWLSQKVIFIYPTSMTFRMLDKSAHSEAQTFSKATLAAIDKQYPYKFNWVRRYFLNGNDMRDVPTDMMPGYLLLRHMMSNEFALISSESVDADLWCLKDLSDDESLRKISNLLHANLATFSGPDTKFIYIANPEFLNFISLIFVIFTYYLYGKMVIKEYNKTTFYQKTISYALVFSFTSIYFANSKFIGLSVPSVLVTLLSPICLIAIAGMVIAFTGKFLDRLAWPNNPCLSAISDITVEKKTKAKEI